MNTGELIQIGVGVVLTLTLVAVLWYAWEARKQAAASSKMAEAMLCPVIEQWIDPTSPLGDGTAIIIEIK